MPYDSTKPFYVTQKVGGIGEEGVDGRFDRDYESMGTKVQPEDLYDGDDRYDGSKPYAGAGDVTDDDRKERQLERQSNERQSRLYVDPATGVSETGKDHPQKDVLWEASDAKDVTDPAYPSADEINDAYEASAENENLPSGM